MKIIRTPVLPYNGTSGHQDTDTSYERAKRMDSSGITAERQKMVYHLVLQNRAHGITAQEARRALGFNNPNQVSPSFTVLHKAGYLARLLEKRDGHRVYVHPDYLEGRDSD